MLNRFDKYVEQGLISKKISPCGKLVLFDYTEKCQWEKAWDEITLNARGSVYEISTGKLVARSFPKFFNFSELSPERQNKLISQRFTVAEKMDGSLGIIYFYEGRWRVNTRGSFESDQAKKGLELLEKYTYGLDEGNTYLVEIIYPENRIVVDYKGEEKLVHLATFCTKEDVELPYHPFESEAKTYDFSNLEQLQKKLKELSFNEEGYVVKFEDGTRAKFKGDEYIKMHRIISGLSPLTLWESMKDGKVCSSLMASIPEEFSDPYKEMARKLEKSYEELEYSIEMYCKKVSCEVLNKKQFDLLPEDRKNLGLYLKENDHPYNIYVFSFFLGKGLDGMIKKAIRPTGNLLV